MTTYTIEILNEQHFSLDESRLRTAAETVLTLQKATLESTLTLVIVDDAEIQVMNRDYRGVNSPTDVLSFPADAPPISLEGEAPYLGDLIIAFPYSAAQAARENHSHADNLCLLVIHGTLHLLGFDHDTTERKAAMWSAQEAALLQLGILPAIVPALESYDHDH
jgi:probable rRNA maturation factor